MIRKTGSTRVSTKSTKVVVSVVFAVLALSALFLMPGLSQAELISTLTYTEPTGIIGPNDSVTVWLKFELATDSDPFSTDDAGHITSHSILNTYDNPTLDLFGGSITNSINGFPNPPYDFVWGPGPLPAPGDDQDWAPFWNQFHNLDLEAGESFTYASTTFFPAGGSPVPDGTYTASFYSLAVWGPDYHQRTDADGNPVLDDQGNPIMDISLHDIAVASNTFSRTVESSVPVPATMLLLGPGLACLMGLRRKFSN